MPELKIKDVSLIVRGYFEDIKRSKFIFDIIKVELETANEWLIVCEVANVFDDGPRVYEVRVDDETGDITDVAEVSE